jgi:hypothetical protein
MAPGATGGLTKKELIEHRDIISLEGNFSQKKWVRSPPEMARTLNEEYYSMIILPRKSKKAQIILSDFAVLRAALQAKNGAKFRTLYKCTLGHQWHRSAYSLARQLAFFSRSPAQIFRIISKSAIGRNNPAQWEIMGSEICRIAFASQDPRKRYRPRKPINSDQILKLLKKSLSKKIPGLSLREISRAMHRSAGEIAIALPPMIKSGIVVENYIRRPRRAQPTIFYSVPTPTPITDPMLTALL